MKEYYIRLSDGRTTRKMLDEKTATQLQGMYDKKLPDKNGVTLAAFFPTDEKITPVTFKKSVL